MQVISNKKDKNVKEFSKIDNGEVFVLNNGLVYMKLLKTITRDDYIQLNAVNLWTGELVYFKMEEDVICPEIVQHLEIKY